MLITDLPFLENVSENDLIVGGYTIGAYASAEGDDTYTETDTNLKLKTKKNGKIKIKGKATALAIGEDPIADTFYDLEGCHKVKVKTIEKEGEDFAYEKLKIKAKC